MLRSVKEFDGYPLQCVDGKIGHVTDCLFDEREWALRYVVVDIGSLVGQQVLISTENLEQPDVGWSGRHFHVGLTVDKVKSSPPIDSDAPVSRRLETEVTQHFGHLEPYWERSVLDPEVADHEKKIEEIEQCHLHSANYIRHGEVKARDGEIGYVDDLIVDTESWSLRYFVVNTRDFLPGGKVILDISWLSNAHHFDRVVEVDLTIDQVKHSPKFKPHQPVNRDYENRLFDYYGKPAYWEEPPTPGF